MSYFGGRRALFITAVLLGTSCVCTLGIGYSSLTKQKNELTQDWTAIQRQFEARYCLVPSLVKNTRGLIAKERRTYEQLAEARKGCMRASTSHEESYAQLQFDNAVNRVVALASENPVISKKESYKAVASELQRARVQMCYLAERYNEKADVFNHKLKNFPYNIASALFAITAVPYALITDD